MFFAYSVVSDEAYVKIIVLLMEHHSGIAGGSAAALLAFWMLLSRHLFTKIMKRKKTGTGARMFPETEIRLKL